MKVVNTMDGLSTIWRDLTSEPIWKYEILPPFLVSQLTEHHLLAADDSEISRTIWFWYRRPKLMFYENAVLVIVALCILISLSVALLHWPGTSTPKRIAEISILLVEFAVEIYAINHRLKFFRWRRDYERCIDRLIRGAQGDATTDQSNL